MAELFSARSPVSPLQILAGLGRLILLGFPVSLLLGGALRSTSEASLILWFGTAFQAGAWILACGNRASWSRPIGPYIVTLYLTSLTWFWFGDRVEDWYDHLSKAILIVVPLMVFGNLMLHESGAVALRRANGLAERLANRKEWPADLTGCRALPEVKAFRAALAYDAAPALALLRHPRPEVRLAALAALEFRKEWKPGQAEIVLQAAQRAEQPTLRAAAVMALGNVEDRQLIETLAQFLHDNSREVRRAATEALLWDSDHRWGWIRYAVRRILADPLFSSDGPLLSEGQQLPPEGVKDLMAWCAEKGVLSARAAQTLAAHYNRALSESHDPRLATKLRELLADPHTPAVLRLELGKLMQYHQELEPHLLEKLLDPANPSPLRLIAAETILSELQDELLRLPAVSALRDLARLPNREIALATADVVQRRLGVDLGLGLGQPLPPVHSRQAAEVTRRVVAWATQFIDEEDLENSSSSILR
jgi:HEAT repeat protein